MSTAIISFLFPSTGLEKGICSGKWDMRGSLLGDSWEKNFHGLKKMPGESHLSYKCHHHAWMWGLDLWQPPRLQPEVRASIGAGKSQRNQRSGAVALPSSPWTPRLLLCGIIKVLSVQENLSQSFLLLSIKSILIDTNTIYFGEANCGSTPRWQANGLLALSFIVLMDMTERSMWTQMRHIKMWILRFWPPPSSYEDEKSWSSVVYMTLREFTCIHESALVKSPQFQVWSSM